MATKQRKLKGRNLNGKDGTGAVQLERETTQSELDLRLEEATSRVAILQRQVTMCALVESMETRLAAIEEEVQEIGKLARDHDQARAGLFAAEQDVEGMAASARAVFAIIHHADRHGPLVEELSEATRHHDEEHKLLGEATRNLAREREIFEASAIMRVWRPGLRRPRVDPDAQWVLVEQLMNEVRVRTAATAAAEAVRKRLSDEAAHIDRELAAFQQEHGASPWDVYAGVEAHRQEIRRLRRLVPQLGQDVADRRVALEQSLRVLLEQLQEWGLVSTIPDGAETMVSAIRQCHDVARLEASGLDYEALKIEAGQASGELVGLTRRRQQRDRLLPIDPADANAVPVAALDLRNLNQSSARGGSAPG